ncbi:MAG: toxin-antitoxin system HicB family antitoxin [Chloroflexi bacterium]|nr:toxin-antitoxin system HicB family antitoxin [Chloroflexota bacterium]
MVIRLSPTLEKRVARAAKAKGVKPNQWIETAVKQQLAAEDKRQPEEPVSDARRQLDELLRHKKKVEDFDAAVHAAKRYAGKLLEDNADWIDRVTAQGTEHGRS